MSCKGCGGKNDSLLNRLNKRVVLNRVEHTENQYGEQLPALVPFATVWAAVEPLRGREFFASFTEHAEVTTRIRIRYREGVDRTMVVTHGGIEFEILHIIHTNFDKTELQLMCKERQ